MDTYLWRRLQFVLWASHRHSKWRPGDHKLGTDSMATCYMEDWGTVVISARNQKPTPATVSTLQQTQHNYQSTNTISCHWETLTPLYYWKILIYAEWMGVNVKGKWCHTPSRSIGGMLISLSMATEPASGHTSLYDALPVWHQTYSYLPSRWTMPLLDGKWLLARMQRAGGWVALSGWLHTKMAVTCVCTNRVWSTVSADVTNTFTTKPPSILLNELHHFKDDRIILVQLTVCYQRFTAQKR